MPERSVDERGSPGSARWSTSTLSSSSSFIAASCAALARGGRYEETHRCIGRIWSGSITFSGSFGAVSSCLRASEREKHRRREVVWRRPAEAAAVDARAPPAVEMDEKRLTAALAGERPAAVAARSVGWRRDRASILGRTQTRGSWMDGKERRRRGRSRFGRQADELASRALRPRSEGRGRAARACGPGRERLFLSVQPASRRVIPPPPPSAPAGPPFFERASTDDGRRPARGATPSSIRPTFKRRRPRMTRQTGRFRTSVKRVSPAQRPRRRPDRRAILSVKQTPGVTNPRRASPPPSIATTVCAKGRRWGR